MFLLSGGLWKIIANLGILFVVNAVVNWWGHYA